MSLSKRRAEELAQRRFGDVGGKAVCLSCILDDDLREEARAYLNEESCSFCGRVSLDAEALIAVSFEEFMPIIMRGINFLYTPAIEAGTPWDEGEWVGPTFDTWEVIDEVCSYVVEDVVIEGIRESVDPEDWVQGVSFSESSLDQVLKWAWDALSEKVKYSSRFVFLAEKEESSGHPEDVTTRDLLQRLEQIVIRNDVIREIPEGQTFWRGRLVDSSISYVDFQNAPALGSPPREIASNSRMSPAGISFFYGSEDIDTVIAEIGAHAARRYAVVGQFECMRSLTVLDLVDLPEIPSIFSEETSPREYYERVFLRSFASDLAKPIALDGREHIDYVPTQVVMEYFRRIPAFRIDGVRFRSAQNGGINYALFFGPDDLTTDRAPILSRFGESRTSTLSLISETVQGRRIVARPH